MKISPLFFNFNSNYKPYFADSFTRVTFDSVLWYASGFSVCIGNIVFEPIWDTASSKSLPLACPEQWL